MEHLEPWSLIGEMWLAWFVYWNFAALFTRKTRFREGIFQRFWHIIPLYAGLFLELHNRHFWFISGRLYDNDGVDSLGVMLTFGGLAFSVWARIHLGANWSGIITLKEGHTLTRTGPYQFVRHPIYTGLIAAAIGTAMTNSTGDAYVGLIPVILSCYFKSGREEKLMIGEFGDQYVRYEAEVPGLVPYRVFGLLISAWRRQRGERAIQSEAFAQAALRSEQYRTAGIMGVMVFIAAASAIRSLFIHEHHDYARMGAYLAYLGTFFLFEAGMLMMIGRAKIAGKPPRTWVWAVSTIVECLMPTLVVLFLSADKDYLGPYRALVSSSVMVYFLLVILSTLRLSPAMCVLAGCASAAGYGAVWLVTLWLAPHNSYRQFMPQLTYAFNLLYLVASGLIAAAVAQRIRRHVVAALAEAETRRKLDRIEYDLNVARSIQMGLLPKHAPSVSGYDIAGWSKPADQTGGDYYDWLELPDGKIMFTVADAAGHGIGPALLVAACRAYFRAVAMHNDPLERITAQVDSLLAADVPDGRFITAAIALLEPKENRLSLYSAGHAPMFHYTAAGNQVAELDADQPPLGVQFGADGSRARIFSFAPGDAMVIVTDGFFEYHNGDGQMLGSHAIGAAIRQDHALGAETLIQKLYEQVMNFANGAVQADDMTAVVIKRTAPPPQPAPG
jgi:serine phosphatase RsbU (regulator of sigma subunit)/protein-S-isoprenylcysteine O-methyltransferase Ste14